MASGGGGDDNWLGDLLQQADDTMHEQQQRTPIPDATASNAPFSGLDFFCSPPAAVEQDTRGFLDAAAVLDAKRGVVEVSEPAASSAGEEEGEAPLVCVCVYRCPACLHSRAIDVAKGYAPSCEVCLFPRPVLSWFCNTCCAQRSKDCTQCVCGSEAPQADSTIERERMSSPTDIVFRHECAQVTLHGVYLGVVLIRGGYVCFWGTRNKNERDEKQEGEDTVSFRFGLGEIGIVLPRRHLLRNCALEIALKSSDEHVNFFLNLRPYCFYTSEGEKEEHENRQLLFAAKVMSNADATALGVLRRARFIKLCSAHNKLPYSLSGKFWLERSDVTVKWQHGEISNFEYLSHLNSLSGALVCLCMYCVCVWGMCVIFMYACVRHIIRFITHTHTSTHCPGRSFQDISQYPVFPWVLKDFTSDSIDLKDPSVYRDLEKPMGALDEKRWEFFKNRFETAFEGSDMPPFLYGSHYSTPGIILYFLVRQDPFHELHKQLNGGKLDLPDRLFDSIHTTYTHATSETSDVKVGVVCVGNNVRW
jgi:hypothetical protein